MTRIRMSDIVRKWFGFGHIKSLRRKRRGATPRHVQSLEVRTLLSAAPVMLADLNQTTDHSNPEAMTEVDGTVYFTADDGTSGRELWKTDGITTVRVADINPGSGSSSPHSLVNFNGSLYFSAFDGASGYELWKTDGTTTVRVADIRPGSGSSDAGSMINVNGTLYFRANDGTSGIELWKTDGTTITRVADILPGSAGSFPGDLTNVNGTLYFTATDASGTELWKTDGTTTARVADIRPGSLSSFPAQLTNVNGTLYFTASDGTSGRELWKTDGTTTVRVANIRPGSGSSDPSSLTNVNGTLYFSADDGANGIELWKTDGTTTVLVADLRPGTGNLGSGPSSLTNVNGTLYFGAFTGSGHELWRTDGVSTVRVAAISPSDMTNVNGTLFFSGFDATNGQELWKTDGVTTVRVADIRPGDASSDPRYLMNANGTLYFQANDGATGFELWKSDGITTARIADINQETRASISPPPFLGEGQGSAFTEVGPITYFAADDGVNGFELWKTDGTTTVRVTDIGPDSIGSRPANLTNFNGTLYFSANDGTNGVELWKTDGTTTVLVADIDAGGGSSDPRNLTNVNGTLYFSANDGTNGRELWKLDGTTAVRVTDIHTGSNSSEPSNLTNVNGTLYFSALDGANGIELWKTDGTSTVRVADISPGFSSSFPQELTNVNGTLYFRATDATNGSELWKTDGTNTVRVADIQPGSGDSGPSQLTNVNGTLYFRANDDANGSELWKTDGTNTVRVADIAPGSDWSAPHHLTNVNGTLYFSAFDTNGYELWKTDGTTTVRVADILSGSGSSNPMYLTNVNGTLYFAADDGVNGYELWKTDGTITTRVTDYLDPRNPGEPPLYLTNVNGTLYFAADDGLHGTEPYVLFSNRPPTGITLANASVAENAPGATVGTLTALGDPDAEDSHTFTVDDSRFEVVGTTLKLKAGQSIDHESEPTVEVEITADDGQGGTYTETFTITVTNFNEAPADITLTNNSVTENATGAAIGTLAALGDPDAGASHTFTVDDSRFEVVGTTLKLKAGQSLDHESEPTVDIEVTAEDGLGGAYSEMFTITVTNINESATDITLSNASVYENAAGATVGTLAALGDPDAGASYAFTVDDPRFEIVGTTLKLKAGQSLNHESEPTVDIEVTTDDGQGGNYSERFTITVTNVNEAPTDITLSNSSVAENAPGATIGTLAAQGDPDAGASHTFTVDDERFEVVGTTLKLKAGQSLNHESEPTVDIEIMTDDGQGGTYSETFTITVMDRVAPTVGAFGGIVIYPSNNPPTVLDTDATVVDPDSTQLTGGNLTVHLTMNAQVTDRLGIRSEGSRPGQIGFDGSNVTYAGTVIGTVVGGEGTSPLVITFNSNATPAAAQALLRSITFRNTQVTPSTASRTVEVTITDETGEMSAAVQKTIQIAVSTPPRIQNIGSGVAWAEGQAPVVLPGVLGSVTDTDSPNFEGGRLTLSLTNNARPGDVLGVRHQGSLAGQIGVSGNTIRYGNVVIGTFSGGRNGEPLVVTFTSTAATPAAVSALLKNLTFSSTSDNPTNAVRTVEVVVVDGDGGTSQALTKTISVTPINDAAAINDFSGPVTYTEDGPRVFLDTDATMTDADSADFALGSLLVHIFVNGQSTDQLGIAATETTAGIVTTSGNSVLVGGITIGTFAGGTNGGTLVVNFNANANPQRVSALLQAIQFWNTSNTPSPNTRTIRLTLNDGDGGSVQNTLKSVQVVPVNDVAVIGGVTAPPTFTGTPVLPFPMATLTDLDTTVFSGGTLTIQPTNGTTGDTIALRNQRMGLGQINTVGNQVRSGFTVIGTWSGGVNGAPLVITLNASATTANVQALMRNITFSTTGSGSLPRTLSMTLRESDGTASNTVTQFVN